VLHRFGQQARWEKKKMLIDHALLFIHGNLLKYALFTHLFADIGIVKRPSSPWTEATAFPGASFRLRKWRLLSSIVVTTFDFPGSKNGLRLYRNNYIYQHRHRRRRHRRSCGMPRLSLGKSILIIERAGTSWWSSSFVTFVVNVIVVFHPATTTACSTTWASGQLSERASSLFRINHGRHVGR
jgi:hypothetical protein